jgi:hypothetical protein
VLLGQGGDRWVRNKVRMMTSRGNTKNQCHLVHRECHLRSSGTESGSPRYGAGRFTQGLSRHSGGLHTAPPIEGLQKYTCLIMYGGVRFHGFRRRKH